MRRRRTQKVIAAWNIPGIRLPVTYEAPRQSVPRLDEILRRQHEGAYLYGIFRLKDASQ